MMDSPVMHVTELARRGGTTADTVRYYTRLGLLTPQRDSSNGYKCFSLRDLHRLSFIQQAKRLGFTLAEIRHFIEESEHGHLPCPEVREIMQRRIRENRRKLDEALALQRRMEQALKQWRDRPDGNPDGDAICELIESFEGDDQSLPSSTGVA